MKRVAILLSLVAFFAVSCTKIDLETQVSNVSFTPCKQEVLKSSGLSDNVVVEFTNEGVHITHYNFEVPCDFTTVNVTHTFVNGALNITQQGTPNQANCICYIDVSYTIDGISQDEVNVIFINEVQVYCYNESNILQGTKWKLIEVSIAKDYQQLEIFDYSEKNIIYEFQRNNKLVIAGNVDDLFLFEDFQEGEHYYEYQETIICPTCLPGKNLAIDDFSEFGQAKGWYYCIVDFDDRTTMRISNGKVIEGVYYGGSKFFIKLN